MRLDVRVVRVLAVLLAVSLTFTVTAGTQVYFTQDTDRRFAWLGNDAHGSEDFVAHVIGLINSASTSIDAGTMSFSSTQIGQALANRAKAGVPVRVVRGEAMDPYLSLSGVIRPAVASRPSATSTSSPRTSSSASGRTSQRRRASR